MKLLYKDINKIINDKFNEIYNEIVASNYTDRAKIEQLKLVKEISDKIGKLEYVD